MIFVPCPGNQHFIGDVGNNLRLLCPHDLIWSGRRFWLKRITPTQLDGDFLLLWIDMRNFHALQRVILVDNIDYTIVRKKGDAETRYIRERGLVVERCAQ